MTSKGSVKFYNQQKGYGFIKPEDGSQDIFVHQTGLIDEVGMGDRVTFETTQGKKGVNAVKVRKA